MVLLAFRDSRMLMMICSFADGNFSCLFDLFSYSPFLLKNPSRRTTAHALRPAKTERCIKLKIKDLTRESALLVATTSRALQTGDSHALAMP